MEGGKERKQKRAKLKKYENAIYMQSFTNQNILFDTYSFSSLNDTQNQTVKITYLPSESSILKQKCLTLCLITHVPSLNGMKVQMSE